MAENPELQALIVENPDELDGYLVYGDWLEAEGDPRGKLVALHAAKLRGADRAIDRAIEEHFAAHRAELLGPLAEFTDHQIEAEWRLGFLDRVCLRLPDRQTIGTLRAMLGDVSCCVLRSLEIVQGAQLGPNDYLNVLLETKKPTTLRELKLGSWSLDEDPRRAELKAAFPRLEQPLDGLWTTIVQAVGKARRAATRYEAAELPALVLRPGTNLGDELTASVTNAATVMNALRLEIDKDKKLGVLPALRRTFTADSLDAFMVAVGRQFAEMGEPTNHRWGFFALGALGGDGVAAWLGDQMERWAHQRAGQGCEMLGTIGTGLALYELYGIATDTSMGRTRRHIAAQQLSDISAARKVDLASLLDRGAPTREPAGDASERARTTSIRRLEKQMVSGRRWTAHEFRHYVAEHALVGPHAEQLVWATFDEEDEVQTTFRIVFEKVGPTYVDAKGAAVRLNDRIGVVHPAEAELKAWKGKIAKPLFAQVERPVFALRDQEGGPNLGRFKLRRVDYQTLANVLVSERDWEPFGAESRWDREDEDGIGHGPNQWGKAFKRDNAWIIASLDERRVSMAKVSATVEKTSKVLQFEELHPVTVSEILYDLETAVPQADARERGAKPTREEVAALETRSGVKRGDRVRLGIRANEGKGKWGVVFWIGDKNGRIRCGLKTDDGDTIWADVSELESVSAEEIAASAKKADAKKAKAAESKPALPADESTELAKGDRVRWRNANASGTGKVFWLGAGKFGGGPRAGVKDDDTGETIWTEVAACELIEE